MAKPNIVYVHSHDTGRFIQPYGHAIPAPNIQRLAEEGVLFRQAFCAGPTCSASRAALLTGRWPHNAGMIGLAHRGFSTMDFSQHIVHTLEKAGYHTVLAGIQHVAMDVAAIGYDTVCGHDVPRGERRSAEDYACRFLDSGHPQPFFLDVGFSHTHREFPEAGPEDDPRYCLPPPPLPDTPETRKDMAEYKTSARVLDKRTGAVLDAIDRNGLRENTFVICTTDHGIAFPRMKCNLHDSGIGVMLIMRGPGGFSGGKVLDAMVSQVDIFPTVCDLAGIERPDWLQGVSMMPLIRGEVAEVREDLFSEVTYHASYEPMRCVRTRRWKYIRRFGGRRRPVLPNCDDGLSKNVLLEHGWALREEPEEALYDLVFDPNEANSLAVCPEYAGILVEMRERLDRWMRATDDPLLDGYVRAPHDAQVNDPDGLSPRSAVKLSGPTTDAAFMSFGYENLVGVDSDTLKTAFAAIEPEKIALTLCFASTPLRAKVLGAISENARKVIEDWKDDPTRRFLKDIDEAQYEVLRKVKEALA
jgi:arylsulfatase A-like enzyme